MGFSAPPQPYGAFQEPVSWEDGYENAPPVSARAPASQMLAATRSLNHNEEAWDNNPISLDAGIDNGKTWLSDIRFLPMARLPYDQLFARGSEVAQKYNVTPTMHDISHLGVMAKIDPRSWIFSARRNNSDLTLRHFAPSFGGQEIAELKSTKEVQKAIFMVGLQCRRIYPWDLSGEAVEFFLIKNEWFNDYTRPVANFYRCEKRQHEVIQAFYESVWRQRIEVARRYQRCLSVSDVEAFFPSYAQDRTAHWTTRIPAINNNHRGSGDNNSHSHAQDKKGSGRKRDAQPDQKSFTQIKKQCKIQNRCIKYNTDQGCTATANATGDGCQRTDRNNKPVDLKHSCCVVMKSGQPCADSHPAVRHT